MKLAAARDNVSYTKPPSRQVFHCSNMAAISRQYCPNLLARVAQKEFRRSGEKEGRIGILGEKMAEQGVPAGLAPHLPGVDDVDVPDDASEDESPRFDGE